MKLNGKTSTLHFVCPIEEVIPFEKAENYDLYSIDDMDLVKNKSVIPSYLDTYYVWDDFKETQEFVIDNCTGIDELGSYPYCAIVSIDTLGLIPFERTVRIYKYNISKCKYEFYHELNRDEKCLCPKINL